MSKEEEKGRSTTANVNHGTTLNVGKIKIMVYFGHTTSGDSQLTLQHRNCCLGSNPGSGRILAQIVTPRVVTGSALINPRILDGDASDS